jgi:tetratricopeptide (TPR) repeat protein
MASGVLLACVLLWGVAGHAQSAAKASARLPELPPVPSLELARPAPAELEELDTRLGKLCSNDLGERDAARREMLEVTAKSVAAIRFRLAQTADSSKHDELKELLLKIRKKGRDDGQGEQETEGKRRRTPDYLQMASEHAEPHSKAWCNLVSVLAESRMLAQIGSVEAVRGLIDVYVRYGEFLRVDTQLQLEALGDRAVPALIEAQRHPAEKIAKWAGRELDALGKAIPSEAVQVTDLSVLSDVLRAYGRVRDPDAARIVVSFSNSERAQVREASRQAIAMLGEVGAWQLRDTYETVVGKKPARDWNWERTARELFGEFDGLRSREVSKLFEAGSAARDRGDFAAMRKAFDQVLTRSPDYPKKDELAAAYLAYAQKTSAQDAPDALSALRRAERLGKGTPVENAATSLRLTLEAEALARIGIADRTLLGRALEADPKNSRAASELARLEHPEVTADPTSRYYAAAAIGVAALAAILVVLFRPSAPPLAPRKPETDPGARGSAPAIGEPPAPTGEVSSAAPRPNPEAIVPRDRLALGTAEPQNAKEPAPPDGGASPAPELKRDS